LLRDLLDSGVHRDWQKIHLHGGVDTPIVGKVRHVDLIGSNTHRTGIVKLDYGEIITPSTPGSPYLCTVIVGNADTWEVGDIINLGIESDPNSLVVIKGAEVGENARGLCPELTHLDGL
jgi:hypothetical protein